LFAVCVERHSKLRAALHSPKVRAQPLRNRPACNRGVTAQGPAGIARDVELLEADRPYIWDFAQKSGAAATDVLAEVLRGSVLMLSFQFTHAQTMSLTIGRDEDAVLPAASGVV